MVPRFEEEDPEEFFLQFETVAKAMEWPRKYWPLLVQSALKGKARSTYLSLSEAHQDDYLKVKESVLNAYQITAEYYRVRFREGLKGDDETFTEYAHTLTKLRNRWLAASGVTTFEGLCELVTLEQFIRGVSPDVRVYLCEKEVATLMRAATLAENYSLIHQSNTSTLRPTSTSFSRSVSGRLNLEGRIKQDGANRKVTFNHNTVSNTRSRDCFYCKKPGHFVAKCPKLEGKSYDASDDRYSNLALASHPVLRSQYSKEFCQGESQSLFKPFMFEGSVSKSEGTEAFPVTILRDTAASKSVVVKGAVPFIEEAYTGESVIVQGFGGTVTVPLCRIYLQSKLLSKSVMVGVQDSLPVEGATFLMANDIAGELVVPDPIVRAQPLMFSPTAEVERKYPHLFPVCAVTRSKAKETEDIDSIGKNDSLGLDSLFMVRDIMVGGSDQEEENGKRSNRKRIETGNESESFQHFSQIPISRHALLKAQEDDCSLHPLFAIAGSEKDCQVDYKGYYLRSGLLMRKYRPPETDAEEVWHEVHQIVVPMVYRPTILSLAHDYTGGHLGVKKTLGKILKYFYWPGISSDVRHFCHSCHVCQMSGKPNQKLKPAPLMPIPVVNEPFSKVIIDCVGPLPKSKRGHQFMLTIMCASTRYPEAIPIKNMASKSIIPLLIKFFTQHGLPRSVQSDQGTNFTSKVFKQVMSSLGITQYLASAYHPESQGALERFHQTLKSMLTKFCLETGKDWDEGLPLMLHAIRSAKQESLGYSPDELLFGREIRGPMKLMSECWLDEENPGNVHEYVYKLKTKLNFVRKFALENLKDAQRKMKDNFDKEAVEREFNPGDKVLMLLPVRKLPFQASYQGPFEVIKKVGKVNYVVSTPGRRKSKRLVHVNLIKAYHTQNLQVVNSLVHEVGDELKTAVDFQVTKVEVKLHNSDVLQNPYEKLSHLERDQQSIIIALLSDFLDIFNDVPCPSPVVAHDVILVEGAVPVRQSPYRLSPSKKEILREEVRFLLDHGLIEQSESEWASPCVLVPKSDNTMRMCTDYRRVNALTRADSFPLPRIDDIIDSVGKAPFVTKLDLLKGYYQVPLTDRAKRISAFITPDGLFQYKVMPFGMRNAAPTFQRLMGKVVAGLSGVYAYLDDTLITSLTWEEHVASLRVLFERLKEAHLTVNLVKSEFAHARVIFLGHEIGGGTISPVMAKVEAIQQLLAPTSRKGLMRFLGMAGYYRRFCPNFADVASPLTALVSPKDKFVWSSECQVAFEKIRSILMTKPVLKSPDFSQPFVLQVDASDVAAGAVLLQAGDGGILHPVSFMSTKFKVYQRHYSTIEKEALALLMALEKFAVYLDNSAKEIIVYSDHNPLQFVNRMKNKNQRLSRWCLALQPYNLKIIHIKGKENVLADMLSRPSV
ncbi:uncharacterized protein LOC134766651 [Penaeus indicus]|uniref:uncharacterized protein LOC134766651 n=1 Tax=Penaeus indicus TaxID=29960 RepID=UPI00300CF77D